MTLDEDSLFSDYDQDDKDPTERVSYNSIADPWANLDAAIEQRNRQQEAQAVKFKMDENYTRKIIRYFLDNTKVHIPEIYVFIKWGGDLPAR